MEIFNLDRDHTENGCQENNAGGHYLQTNSQPSVNKGRMARHSWNGELECCGSVVTAPPLALKVTDPNSIINLGSSSREWMNGSH